MESKVQDFIFCWVNRFIALTENCSQDALILSKRYSKLLRKLLSKLKISPKSLIYYKVSHVVLSVLCKKLFIARSKKLLPCKVDVIFLQVVFLDSNVSWLQTLGSNFF